MTRVLVTRAREESAQLLTALRDSGLDPITCPLIRIMEVPGRRLSASAFNWVAFTSRSGVRHGLARLDGPLPSVAAVGPGTEEALLEAGVAVDLVAQIHTQEGLAEALGGATGPVLFLGAADADSQLVEKIGATHVVVYRTVEVRVESVPDADLVALASASAARALSRVRRDIPCVAIGPSTSAAATAAGLHVIEEARSSNLDGLLEAVRLAASRLQSSAS